MSGSQPEDVGGGSAQDGGAGSAGGDQREKSGSGMEQAGGTGGQQVEMVGKQVWRYPLRFEIGLTLISSVRNLAARGLPSHPQILNILRQLATQPVSGLSLVTKNQPKDKN